MYGRALHKDPIQFEPTFQLILLTNHKPQINVDKSTQRRIVLIPFLAQFEEEDKYDKNNPRHKLIDRSIEEKLLNKLDEFLVWLVNGSVQYFKNGLGRMPKTVMEATTEYMEENDDIKNLIKDYCTVDPNGFVYHKELYGLYVSNYKHISQRAFTSLMRNKGYECKRKKKGMVFIGLTMNEVLDEDLF